MGQDQSNESKEATNIPEVAVKVETVRQIPARSSRQPVTRRSNNSSENAAATMNYMKVEILSLI